VRFILAVDDKNRPLLTGGRCSEVAVGCLKTPFINMSKIDDKMGTETY